MTHVRLIQDQAGRPPKLEVDGVDMSRKVLAEGFRVDYDAETYTHRVNMVVAADTLEVDLPGSVLKAVAAHETADDAIRANNVAANLTLNAAAGLLEGTRAEIKRLRADMAHHARQTGREVGRAVNAAVTKAARSQGGEH